MILNESVVKYVLKPRNLIKPILIMFIFYIYTMGIILYIYSSSFENDIMKFKVQLDLIYHKNPDDNSLRKLYDACKLIHCKKAIYESNNDLLLMDFGEYYVNYTDRGVNNVDTELAFRKGYIEEIDSIDDIRSKYFSIFTKSYDLIIEYHDKYFIVDYFGIVSNTIDVLISLSMMGGIFFIALSIINAYFSYKKEEYEKHHYQMYVENVVKANMTEMLYHEISVPLSILKTIHEELSDYFAKAPAGSKGIEFKKKTVASYNYAIERFDSILGVLYDTKIVKTGKEQVNIYELLVSTMANINKFNVRKLTYTFNNEDILKIHSVHPKLTNGGFLNVIQVLINNSLEAKATAITFSVEKLQGDMLAIYVGDNGPGIRGTDNKILNDPNVIFKYGYTTKNSKGEQLVYKSLLYRLLSMVGVRVVKENTGRGIGLFMDKLTLNKVGGDIKVHSTSSKGTIFAVHIPTLLGKN